MNMLEALQSVPLDSEVTLLLNGGQTVVGEMQEWNWENDTLHLCRVGFGPERHLQINVRIADISAVMWCPWGAA